MGKLGCKDTELVVPELGVAQAPDSHTSFAQGSEECLTPQGSQTESMAPGLFVFSILGSNPGAGQESSH